MRVIDSVHARRVPSRAPSTLNPKTASRHHAERPGARSRWRRALGSPAGGERRVEGARAAASPGSAAPPLPHRRHAVRRHRGPIVRQDGARVDERLERRERAGRASRGRRVRAARPTAPPPLTRSCHARRPGVLPLPSVRLDRAMPPAHSARLTCGRMAGAGRPGGGPPRPPRPPRPRAHPIARLLHRPFRERGDPVPDAPAEKGLRGGRVGPRPRARGDAAPFPRPLPRARTMWLMSLRGGTVGMP